MKIRFLLFFLLMTSVQLFAGSRDTRVREYITPQRIVWQKNAELIKDIDCLLQPGIGQADLEGRVVCTMSSTKEDHPAILFDFGKELQGGLQIVTGFSSKRPVNIRVRLGESVSEAMAEYGGEYGTTNDHATRDFELMVPWLGVTEIGNSGFRFARIDLLDDSTDLKLKEVRAISIYRDIPYKGSFRCNDDRLNQIWQTGAHTVHLNMQEYLWDGVKRDRLVWIGDMHPEVMTINTVFGYNEVVPKSLDLIRDITPLPNWMNGMCSYSIWWLLIQRDWYYYQGNYAYLKEQQTYLTGLLRQLIGCVGKDGVEHMESGGRFLDWPSSPNTPAINAGLQGLVAMAMEAGEELCRVLDENVLADECKSTRERMLKAASKVIKPMQQSGVAPDAPGSKQAAALMTLSGLMKPEVANQQYLSYNGAHGFSTFYGYYMLRAMAAAGNYQGALDVIRQYWGGMIDLGATSFWEDFNIDWLENAARIDELVPEGKVDVHHKYGDYCYKGFRHSFSHGWASGPTSWLSEHVLGVHVTQPGCREVRIIPHLGDLQWVEGTFPTPYGIIKIRHEKNVDGMIKSLIDAPNEIKVITE